MKLTNFMIPLPLKEKLDKYAKTLDISTSELIRRILTGFFDDLERYLKEQNAKPGKIQTTK